MIFFHKDKKSRKLTCWSTQDIINEYKRLQSGQLVKPEDDIISRLPKDCFLIWIADEATDWPLLTDEGFLEEKILEM